MKWPVPSWRWHTDCWDSPIVYLCWVWGWKMCTTWLVEGRDLLSLCSIMLCAVCWVDCIRRKWRKFTEDKINGGFFLWETISRSFFFLFRSRVSSTLKDRSMFEVCHRHHDNCKDMYIWSLILASFYVKMNVMAGIYDNLKIYEYVIIDFEKYWCFFSVYEILQALCYVCSTVADPLLLLCLFRVDCI